MIIGSEVVLGLIIFTYALYITCFPLFKTIPLFKIAQGNLQVLKERCEQGVKTSIDEGYISLFDPCVGFAMSDGGDSVEGTVSGDRLQDNLDCV